MNIESSREFLLYCTIISYGILIVWFFYFLYKRDLIFREHSRWFKLNEEQFDVLMYVGMMIFKLMIMVFFLIPYIALVLMGRG
jgi:hypothetical protein